MEHVEITGVNFKNKGAHLMLMAIVDQIRRQGNSYSPYVALRNGSFKQRSTVGVGHLVRIGAPKLASIDPMVEFVGNLTSRRAKAALNLASVSSISTILDASGFLYSDQWGEKLSAAASAYYSRWKKPKRKLVLLPQAFGPFENPRVRRHMTEILRLADLVYARDRKSYEYLLDLGSRSDHIRLVPDITHLLEPAPREGDSRNPNQTVIIIPNMRMIDMGGFYTRESYCELLTRLISHARLLGFECMVIPHEASDLDLAQQIAVRSNLTPPTASDTNPLKLKQLLGSARLVISSRFHGLVSTLSQGTPALAVGWSHKYEQLFADYCAVECIIPDGAGWEEVKAILERELDDTHQVSRRAELASRAAEQKAAVQNMWEEIFKAKMRL